MSTVELIAKESDFILRQIDLDHKKIFFRWFRKNSHTLTFQKWRLVSPVKYKIQLIYTMIKRLKYICSTEKILYEDLECLKESFRYSGYPEHIIKKHFFQSDEL